MCLFLQLGDGTNANQNMTGTDILTGVAAVAGGYGHTCACTTAGGVRCWGWNTYGQVRRQQLRSLSVIVVILHVCAAR